MRGVLPELPAAFLYLQVCTTKANLRHTPQFALHITGGCCFQAQLTRDSPPPPETLDLQSRRGARRRRYYHGSS